MDTQTSSEQEAYHHFSFGDIYVKHWTPLAPSDQIPLILLHDSLGSVGSWREFPSLLCAHLNKPVIAYDRLGFGKSSERRELPSTRFIEEEAEIYFSALKHALKIDRFDLFGYSVGGGMAIACATKIPGCRSVVTESAQAFVEARTRDGILKARTYFSDPENLRRLAKYHGSKSAWVLKAWIDVWLSSEFRNWSLASLLPQVQCPLLALHGDRDEYGSTAFPEMIRDLAGGKSKMLVIRDCGHVPHREKTGIILESVSAFLSNLKR